ncbi:MAG: PHP-associated domain-containing protein, partial [Clostridia bacterium]
AASFKYRMTSMSHCRRIASLCAHYGARIMVNSDAHVAQMVGEVSSALKMLKDINFPEELVVNSSLPRLSAYFKETKRLDILDERA